MRRAAPLGVLVAVAAATLAVHPEPATLRGTSFQAAAPVEAGEIVVDLVDGLDADEISEVLANHGLDTWVYASEVSDDEALIRVWLTDPLVARALSRDPDVEVVEELEAALAELSAARPVG